ncbi:MAG: L-rhamnose mutarotase [Candidatus Spyradocola sp.]
MEKCTWKATLLPGMRDEYVRRHDEIWPEMKETLAQAGIVNYTIWRCGDELFGYYECEKGAAYAAKVQAESPVVDRWNEYMRDVMVMDFDPETGTAVALENVFSFRTQDDA